MVVMLAGSGVHGQESPSTQKPAATATAAAPKAAATGKKDESKKADAKKVVTKKEETKKAAAGKASAPASKAPATKQIVPTSKPAAPASKAPATKQIVPTSKPVVPAGKAAAPSAPAAKAIVPAGKVAQKTPAGKPKEPVKEKKPEKAEAKPPATKPAMDIGKAAAPSEAKPEGSGTPAAGEPAEGKVIRRDPFRALIGADKTGTSLTNLPPGIAGLQVNGLRLDGVVRAPNGMIAVVSNDQARTYFLREGDQLYDGRVEKIMMDSVSFHEVSKDAFGRAVERQVIKRIYSRPGEKQ